MIYNSSFEIGPGSGQAKHTKSSPQIVLYKMHWISVAKQLYHLVGYLFYHASKEGPGRQYMILYIRYSLWWPQISIIHWRGQAETCSRDIWLILLPQAVLAACLSRTSQPNTGYHHFPVKIVFWVMSSSWITLNKIEEQARPEGV